MTIGELVAILRLDDSAFVNRVRDARDKLDGLGGKMNSVAAGIVKAGLSAGAGIAAIGTAVTAVGGLLAGLGTAAGALGVLPAAFAAVKLATATVTVGMSGFSEALAATGEDAAAFEEAIAGLAPQAQEAARAFRGLRPAWDALKMDVQNKLFSEMGSRITELGGQYLPILSDSMGYVAEAFNTAGHDVADFFSESEVVGDVGEMFDNLKLSVRNVSDGMPNLIEAFYIIARVGSDFLPGLTGGFAGATERFREFIGEARRTGELREWIQGGLDALRRMGELLGNVGEIFSGVFRAADTGGASFMQRLLDITQRIADMVNSVEGQKALGTFFTTAAQLSDLFMQALSALMPVLPSLVQVLSTLALTVGQALLTAITTLAPYLQQFTEWAAANPGAVQAIVVVVGTLAIAIAGLVGALNLYLAVARIVAGVQALMASGWIGTIASAVAAAAAWIASWVASAAAALVSAASMAASWIIAMGPIGWVIAAVVGLVALIIANWDQVSAWTQQAWSAVSQFVADAWANITTWVQEALANVGRFFTDGWNNAVRIVSDAWQGIVSTVTSKGEELLGFIRGIPGWIMGALGNLGNLLVGSGQALVDGFLSGIRRAWDGLVGWVRDGMAQLRGLWPFSPAKDGPFSGAGYVTHSGKALTGDFAKSLRAGMPGVVDAARAVMDATHLAITPTLDARPTGLPGDAWLGPPPSGAAASSYRGGDRTVQVVVNNPVAEKASDTLGRRARTLAALGPFGGDGDGG